MANYAKGTSEAATVKAMPTQAIPYSLDRDKAAKNQPIPFTFNTADYPTATDGLSRAMSSSRARSSNTASDRSARRP